MRRSHRASRLAATWPALALLAATWPSCPSAYEGIHVPAVVWVDAKRLELNGVGLRTATPFRLPIYVIALYLEEPTGDAGTIIASRQTKRVVMRFVRSVSARRIRRGWSTSLARRRADAHRIRRSLDAFKAGMRDMDEGGRIVIDFVGDRVELTVDGSRTASIEGRAFQRALLSTWLGENAADAELEGELLGGEDRVRTNER